MSQGGVKDESGLCLKWAVVSIRPVCKPRGFLIIVKQMVIYRVLLAILILLFAASVTCAAVCGQQADEGKKHEDGSPCDECVSTAFEFGTKIVNAGWLSTPVEEPMDGGTIFSQSVQPLGPLPQFPTDSPPSLTVTSSILRI